MLARPSALAWLTAGQELANGKRRVADKAVRQREPAQRMVGLRPPRAERAARDAQDRPDFAFAQQRAVAELVEVELRQRRHGAIAVPIALGHVALRIFDGG